MIHLVLQHNPDGCTGPCGLCGQSVTLSQGLQLFLIDKRRPVCTCCGRKAAPALAALLGLACAAEHYTGTSPCPLTAGERGLGAPA